MHARNRNIGNGYRAGSLGMGFSASRVSPEGSTRAHGFHHGSDHRGFNRGYGRGWRHPKPFQNQPPPPPTSPLQRKGGDILIEAGRMAAEYLVSQGALSPTVLTGKWQNSNFMKQDRRLQGAQMGGCALDAEKRRYFDDYSSSSSRSNLKGRRSYHHGSAFRRNGSFSERNKASEGEINDNSFSGHREEQPLVEDIASSIQRSNSGESARKHEGGGGTEYNLQDEAQSKTASSSGGNNSKVSEASSILSAGSKELKSDVDLVTLCKFAKVPTRTRSCLTTKGPKHDSREDIVESCHNSDPRRCESPGKSSEKVEIPPGDGKERGEKRTLEEDELGGAKRQKQSLPSECDEQLDGLKEEKEQQIVPGSFKICDLNLEGPSDTNKNTIDDPVILYHTMNACRNPIEEATRMSNGKEIEVIDLEDDSSGEEVRKQEEAPFMEFSQQPRTGNDISEEYNEGLTMVEFLDSFGNIPPMNSEISSVSEGINNTPLQNPEGALGSDQLMPQADDDSIFMSLGEIPLTFLQAWDQPPARSYEKPF